MWKPAKRKTQPVRRTPRIEASVFVRNDWSNFNECYCRLGADGCYIEMGNAPEVGQVLDLRIHLRGTLDVIDIVGRVTSVALSHDHTGVAVRFETMLAEDEKKLHDWMDMMAPCGLVAAS